MHSSSEQVLIQLQYLVEFPFNAIFLQVSVIFNFFYLTC